MRLRGYRLMMALGMLLGACAEPTGTESGNPSLPGAHTPMPKLPPVAPPPLPDLPVQPSPTIVLPTESTQIDIGAEGSPPPPEMPIPSQSTEEPLPTHPTAVDGTPGPVAGPAGVPTGEGPGATHPPPPSADTGSGETDPVDAGYEGGVDAGS